MVGEWRWSGLFKRGAISSYRARAGSMPPARRETGIESDSLGVFRANNEEDGEGWFKKRVC